ncbi:D-alanyl-D-alanine carboxypeptidase/D-alanyl-D-alanine-endopeptidase [Pedobacter xixiisoli]|uniref:D-alanyl-D-alanine carboxypeptidase / D-alanyl-D-alanine-endopeptidase (Penicillin-binding protein 4) n=1 Tax=Pedobacter xixiisoli TaxID=1476464 RepID=A0A286AA92_9SPHI|nr:D-alanyl-D-alanine carboxypeptidase/D-alanyl-D-alanine-endopeptidase [Pedobacter xixiisoli]SOD18836.1 D-alanyl-D-alanine carboxypeptidase / D-alanyl-D-alanine-endopeptidase (penicillin-binding protein 4) [Pedobacter xixiisoli]
MKRILYLLLFALPQIVNAQTTAQKLERAYQILVKDEQAKYAITSLCILDANTGKVIFANNENIGLAPASTLKTITSATAFYNLSKDFRYETKLSYTGKITAEGTLQGDIIITGSGDPTLGSWRYEQTKENNILNQWVVAIKAAGIKKIEGSVVSDDSAFGTSTIPTGWIWQDIGNYYGAGAGSICWRENQFDVHLRAGSSVESEVQLVKTVPQMPYIQLVNELTTGASGTGDNAYGFLPPYTNIGYIRGTWGMGIKKSGISLALPDAAFDVAYRLQDTLKKLNIECTKNASSARLLALEKKQISNEQKPLLTIFSPTLSQMVYWFQKKSINLYGEQLIKTLAYKQGKEASTKNGAKAVIDFWSAKGIDKNALNMIDGSGLSPANRVTSMAMASILFQAQKESWFSDYLNSFPDYNGMNIKSGNINDVTAYAGYYTAKNGSKYIAVININNYSGSGISRKLFQVLDALK